MTQLRSRSTVPPIPADDPSARDLLRRAVEEAVSLLRADGGLVYLLDADGETLYLLDEAVVAVNEAGLDIASGAAGLRISVGSGLFGTAVRDGTVVRSGQYLTDAAFRHDPGADRFVVTAGISSMIVAPLAVGDQVLGALGVFARRSAAFDDNDTALVRSLAGHAATILANTILIEELERSTNRLALQAERERTLRELTGSLAEIRDTTALLQRVVDAAATVAGAQGAFLDRIDPDGRVHTAVSETVVSAAAEDMVRHLEDAPASGLMGLAVAERRVVKSDDYLADKAFAHAQDSDDLALELQTRSVVAAPLIADGKVLGVLAAYSDRVAAFDEDAMALIGAFADHAAVAIANARLIEALESSAEQLARRASAEHALREIASQLTTIHEADAVLERTVAAASRLVGAEWAEVARVEPDAELVWTHVFGLQDPALRAEQRRLRMRVGQGVLGLAAERRRPVVTGDYLADDAFLHDPAADAFARRTGFHSLIAAPMIADDEVVGVLAVHGARPDAFDDEHVALVASFADVAAIAVANARLIEERDRSEMRYRGLLAASPDIVFAVDPAGRFTFLSDTLERQLGWGADDMLGKHFSALIDASSLGVAQERWQTLREQPGVLLDARFLLIHRDGRRIPYEIRSFGFTDDAGFAGVQGAARDVSERESLERDLRDSEERYRNLVEESPDVVFSADPAGVITFMSETSERVFGWRPDEVIGEHFARVIHPDSLQFVHAQYAESVAGAPTRDLRYRFDGLHRDGSRIPLEMHARAVNEGGVYQGVHGAVRDIRERERLERDLRRQAADLAAAEERAHLARELHDSVTQALFSMTLVTRSIELLLDRDLDAARARLATLGELQKDALAEMRALIFELRPASLESEGLVQALRTHCAAVEGRLGLPIVIEADEEVDRLPPDVEAALFRIAQEALTNVVKHAAAKHVRIAVERTPTIARLTVEDDGVGMDLGAVPEGHLGLVGMRARAEKLGGIVEVSSVPGRGATVRVELPLVGVVGAAS